MGEILSAAAVHKQYDEAMTAFRRCIPDPRLRLVFARESDAFMRACAAGLWGVDGGLSPLHVEYHNAIYCKGAAVPTSLFWELGTLVSDYPGFQPPVFFRELLRSSGGLARRFVDVFTLMMLLFAAVDGRVSEAEAAFVNRCADTLTALCDSSGVEQSRKPVRADEFVAPAAQVAEEPAEAVPEVSLDELLAELDGLCGLEKVKSDARGLINLVNVRKLREEAGLPVPPMSLHLVFLGNPGTGKTTVARLLARIYHAIGVLSKGQLIEVDRSGLVAGFVGQTAIKTREVIEKALGGVLFIDEAYALANQESPNDFGREAIEVLLKGMEDHRKDLIVIAAGYPDLMEKFIRSNPGLESRFNKYFQFDDYNGGELMSIFRSMCEKNGYTLDAETDAYCAESFHALYAERDENFGNARDVRNIFEHAVARQANRLAALASPGREDLMALCMDDIRGEDEPSEQEGAEAT